MAGLFKQAFYRCHYKIIIMGFLLHELSLLGCSQRLLEKIQKMSNLYLAFVGFVPISRGPDVKIKERQRRIAMVQDVRLKAKWCERMRSKMTSKPMKLNKQNLISNRMIQVKLSIQKIPSPIMRRMVVLLRKSPRRGR